MQQNEKNQLYQVCLSKTACPAGVRGELEAFRAGLAAAVEIICAQADQERVQEEQAEEKKPEPENIFGKGSPVKKNDNES